MWSSRIKIAGSPCSRRFTFACVWKSSICKTLLSARSCSIEEAGRHWPSPCPQATILTTGAWGMASPQLVCGSIYLILAWVPDVPKSSTTPQVLVSEGTCPPRITFVALSPHHISLDHQYLLVRSAKLLSYYTTNRRMEAQREQGPAWAHC